MQDRLLHTPEGVRDIYHGEYAKKQVLENRLHKVFRLYGYQDMETPTFEFFDVFGKEVGTTPSNELYKFFDREGNTLVLRPDFTPSIARAASKYFADETMPLRISYAGNTFINHSSYRGKLRESTQMGGELLGEESVEADAEMIALTIELLLEAGLKEFQVSVGHAAFFRGFAKEAGLTADQEIALKNLISMKNMFGVEEYLSNLSISEEHRRILVSLTNMLGGREILEQAAAWKGSQKASEAVSRLLGIYEVLKLYGLEHYVSFDLGMLSNYDYYTGIIFRGYTYGTGDAVVKGGRYDSLLSHFGKDVPAIGFAVYLDELLLALSRQKIELPVESGPTLLLYEKKDQKEAFLEASNLRRQGCSVILMEKKKEMDDYQDYAKRNGFYAVRLFQKSDSLAM